jgi:hypothetical protein
MESSSRRWEHLREFLKVSINGVPVAVASITTHPNGSALYGRNNRDAKCGEDENGILHVTCKQIRV